MIRNCLTTALLALTAAAIGCRACEEPCDQCGPTIRSGSVSGEYPGPVYSGQPVYTQPGAVQPGAGQPVPAPARPMVPVR